MFSNRTSISNMRPVTQLHQDIRDNSTQMDLIYSPSTIKISLIILGLEVILGVVANLAVFSTLRSYCNRSMSVYRVLVYNLCLTGALSSLIGIPSLFAVIYVSFVERTSVPAALCRIRYFSLTYFFFTDSMNICFLSLDRNDFITRPFRRRITKRNIKTYIAAIWAIPFVIGLLNFVIKINTENCILVSSAEGPYSEPMVVLLSVILVLTCSFVVTNNWSSVRSMRNLARSLNTSKKNHARSEKKMIILTVKIISVYLVTVAPATLWSFGLRAGGVKNCVLCNDVRIYLQLLLLVKYLANPFIFVGSIWRKKNSVGQTNLVRKNGFRGQTVLEVRKSRKRPIRGKPREFLGEASSYGDIHQLSTSRRVVTIYEENEERHIESENDQVAYQVNRGRQTNLEVLNTCPKRRHTGNTDNSLPDILVHSFSRH